MIEFEYIMVKDVTVARCILSVLEWSGFYDAKTDKDFDEIEELARRIIDRLEKRISCEEASDD